MDLTQPWEFGDVTFTVEEKKIYANKAVVSMSSEVFKAMFTSDFKEKKMTEIPLPEKKFGDFLQLMHIVHPQILKHVDDTNVHSILPLAHEYQMQGVLENCCKTISDGAPSILRLNMIEKYNLKLPEFHKKCLKYMTDMPLKQLQREPGFTEFKPETLIEVLTSKVEKLEPYQREVSNIASWVKSEQQEYCTDEPYPHNKGTTRDCSECKVYRFDKICEVMKK